LESIWKNLLKESIDTPEALSLHLEVDTVSLQKVINQYPMKINRYFFDLALKKGPSLLKQIIPSACEIDDAIGMVDPLGEEKSSPVPGLIHRYPDRVCFLVSNVCGVYCRFCTRKRRVGQNEGWSQNNIEEGIAYICQHPQVKDVLLSGGDPLLLSNEKIDWLLNRLHAIPHVEMIRIGTRIPSVLPQRITPKLIHILKKYAPLFLNVHFNHPDEISPEAKASCNKLADAGIPLSNQTVLLQGINDNSNILTNLFRALLCIRVKPYYLHQADLTRGADHFRTSIDTGMLIMKELRGHVSGMAVPYYVIDLPGGGGKVPLTPDYIVRRSSEEITVRNFQGRAYRYPQPHIHDSKQIQKPQSCFP